MSIERQTKRHTHTCGHIHNKKPDVEDSASSLHACIIRFFWLMNDHAKTSLLNLTTIDSGILFSPPPSNLSRRRSSNDVLPPSPDLQDLPATSQRRQQPANPYEDQSRQERNHRPAAGGPPQSRAERYHFSRLPHLPSPVRSNRRRTHTQARSSPSPPEG